MSADNFVAKRARVALSFSIQKMVAQRSLLQINTKSTNQNAWLRDCEFVVLFFSFEIREACLSRSPVLQS